MTSLDIIIRYICETIVSYLDLFLIIIIILYINVARNIGVQKICRFHLNPPKIKYWRIFNLVVAYPVSMTLCMYVINIGGF